MNFIFCICVVHLLSSVKRKMKNIIYSPFNRYFQNAMMEEKKRLKYSSNKTISTTLGFQEL